MSEGNATLSKPWPVELREGEVLLRPLRLRDGRAWRQVRTLNSDWLGPWEATHPAESGRPPSFAQMVRGFSREARSGRMLPFALDHQGRFVGQITVSGLHWGSLRSGHIGYWIDRRLAGRGLVPTGVAMAVDYCFFGLGLHRIEVNIRPENVASRRVVEKLGFRPEGLRARYLHIDGAWRDHLSFALTVEDVPNGVLPGWRQRQADDEALAVRRRLREAAPGATE